MMIRGTQSTGFTSTKVQKLTLEALRAREIVRRLRMVMDRDSEAERLGGYVVRGRKVCHALLAADILFY
jgi:hypothetical protein